MVIDKPENRTSADITNRLKKISGIIKTGHTGTLDPFASGVLICTINQATRLSRFFLHGEKKYQGVLALGIDTDTQDSTGNVLKIAPYHHITNEEIQAIFKRFEGNIQQVPPAFSALKHHGVPLYKYARKGMPVLKPARSVLISAIHITSIALPEIAFEVSCSAGTYIRTLCADIGNELGCGGHLKKLRRIESSGFEIAEAIQMKNIEVHDSTDTLKDYIISMPDSLRKIEAYAAESDLENKIKYGKDLTSADISWDSDEVPGRFFKIIGKENRLLAVVERSENEQRYNYCCVFANP